MNYLKAQEIAVKLGAVWSGDEFIVVPNYPRQRSILFGHYFFNAEGHEVGHWIVDFDRFMPFDKPRVWGMDSLANLKNIKDWRIKCMLSQ